MPDTETTRLEEVRRAPGSSSDSRARMAIQAALEHRLRSGPDSFAFEALISGVSTLTDTAAETVLEAAPSDRPADSDEPLPPALTSSAVVVDRWDDSAQSDEYGPAPHVEHTVRIRPFVAFALVVIVAAATSLAATSAYLRTAAPKIITSAKSPAAWISEGLPDPRLTPGDRGPKPILSYRLGDDLRKQVFTSYGLDGSDPRLTICMLIPASLGGTTEPKNLFPASQWYADLKVRLDKKLTDEIAAGSLTLEQAETELKRDWLRATYTHQVRNFGSGQVESRH